MYYKWQLFWNTIWIQNLIRISLHCQNVLFLFKIMSLHKISVVLIHQVDSYNKIFWLHQPKQTIFAHLKKKISHIEKISNSLYVRIECSIQKPAILKQNNFKVLSAYIKSVNFLLLNIHGYIDTLQNFISFIPREYWKAIMLNFSASIKIVSM